MLSYRYMFMNMEPNFNGTTELSPSEVFAQGFPVTPVDMQMEMHMVGLMYGLTDKITLAGMVNFVDLQMLHERSPGLINNVGGPRNFTTESSGIGDATLGALFSLYQGTSSLLHGGLSVVLPTAGTAEEDEVPGFGTTVLPFPMQLGSGSWGLRPSVTYTGHYRNLGWGAQVMAQINLNDNEDGYRLGDTITASLWASYDITDHLSTSFRIQGSGWRNIEGIHEGFEIPQGAVPTVRPDLRGGQRVDALIELSYRIPKTSHRISAEYGEPLWQDLDGPQLGTDFTLNLGLQAIF